MGGMRLKLPELQVSDPTAQKTRAKELQKSWEEIDRRLYHQDLPLVPKIL